MRTPCLISLGKFLVAVALFSGLTTGCKTADPLAPATSGQVQKGMSAGTVHQLLGSPTYREQSPEGVTVETFETVQTIFGSYGVREREEALEIRQFSVRYDADDRVTESFYHRGVLEGLTMIYSHSLGAEITSEKLRQVRSGRTTRAELDAIFGPPTMARLALEPGLRLEWIYDYIEASAVTPGSVYRSVEVILNDANVVTSVKTVDRILPTWRR